MAGKTSGRAGGARARGAAVAGAAQPDVATGLPAAPTVGAGAAASAPGAARAALSAALAARGGIARRATSAVLAVVTTIPSSREGASDDPGVRAVQLARRAAGTAAGISGTAALVPGPLGVVSLLPDMVAVWSVQAQLVADIAAAYGRSGSLTREHMLYCLFKHLFSQGLRELAVRNGGRVLVRHASLKAMQSAAERIGIKLTQRALGNAVARWLPVVGAAGVGAYAYYDTRRVAATATMLFGDGAALR